MAWAPRLGHLGLKADIDVVTAASGADLAAGLPSADVVVLDAQCGWVEPFEVCERARRADYHCLIMVTGLPPTEVARVTALEAGADDCLSTSQGVAELLARVRALARRSKREYVPTAARPDVALRLSPEDRSVAVQGSEIRLSRREYGLLDALVQARGRVVSRRWLLRQVWGREDGSGKIVDVTLGRLRAKLDAGGVPELVTAVRGLGFRFDAEIIAMPGSDRGQVRGGGRGGPSEVDS